jgi:glycosidase
MSMSFLSNHDMDRIAGAFITENVMRMAANLYLLSPGSPVIYYGEEIGMRGSRGSASTDANRRLAMLWGDGDSIANPIGSTYSEKNQISSTVATQIEDENSLYTYYCKLISIRHKHPGIARGDYNAVNCGSKNLGGFLVTYKDQTIGLFHNTSDVDELTLDLSKLDVKLSTISDVIGLGNARIDGNILYIDPQTSVIIK